MENSVEGILLMAFGVFPLIASIRNWNWFFENRKARIFVKLFGRTGARVFYTLLGLFFFVVGFRMMFFV